MAAHSKFDEAFDFYNSYLELHGKPPTKAQIRQHVQVCESTMADYTIRFRRYGIEIPDTRAKTEIDAVAAWIAEFETANGRQPYLWEVRNQFDKRGRRMSTIRRLLEKAGIILAEFAPIPLPPPQPEIVDEPDPDDKPVGRTARNERDPRPEEEYPHGLRIVLYHRHSRTLRYFSDGEVISEAASETEAIPFLDRLEQEGVYTATA